MSGSADFICALCAKGASKKGKEKKPVYLRSLLFHLSRKQKRQLAQGFPSFDEKLQKCHPSCYYRFKIFARHHQFFSRYVICAICLENLLDNEDALVPPCNIIEHSLHKNCIEYQMNGCAHCRVGHSVFKDRLRTRRKLNICDWTVL
jgi:hypothetical protein